MRETERERELGRGRERGNPKQDLSRARCGARTQETAEIKIRMLNQLSPPLSLLFNVATRKFKIMSVICVVSLLGSGDLDPRTVRAP